MQLLATTERSSVSKIWIYEAHDINHETAPEKTILQHSKHIEKQRDIKQVENSMQLATTTVPQHG